jgi:hypothetical protein
MSTTRAATIDISQVMASLAHGTHKKHMFVCHETVSYNVTGLADILGVENVLKREGYGIHGLTDREGHKCWAHGHGNAIFWHAGDVNDVAVGVENISEIPILIQAKKITHEQAHEMWLQRPAQLTALAILIACWHNSSPENHPLKRSNGKIESHGVCSHWDVSQHYKSSGGHWDCWPHDKGGYFPLAHVLSLAKHYAAIYKF